jgi:hypothetical protein
VPNFGISGEELKGPATSGFSETETRRADLPVDANKLCKLHVDICGSGSVKWWASVLPALKFFKCYQKINVTVKALSRILEIPGTKCPQNNCPKFILGSSSATSGVGQSTFEKPKTLSFPSTTQNAVLTVY